MISAKTTMAAFAAVALSAAAGWADEMGKQDFMAGCAGGHGESGMGQGPLAEMLTVEVPDLTHLSANNDGKFPMLDVIHVIDGRTGVRAHGDPMPVWGTIFKADAAGDSGLMGGAEALARGRILSIAYYLESIQQ
ncbi:MAG: 3-methyladenine DNA glycosylase [Rhodobacteraceae bacterium]|nr:3-methyladenine DNA glycosylase [Paracoccaceae bacterium]